MSLADIIRNGVALANSVTAPLQETVTLQRWKGQDSYGQPTYATSITLTALVEHRRRRFRSDTGEETVSTAQVTILGPVSPLSPAVTGRKDPVDERDKLTLANGQAWPILGTDGGLADPSTGYDYLTTVFLG